VYYGNSVECTGDNRVMDMDWSKVPASKGVTIELCAGIVDETDFSLDQIIQKEVLEECGYDVPLKNFEKVLSYR